MRVRFFALVVVGLFVVTSLSPSIIYHENTKIDYDSQNQFSSTSDDTSSDYNQMIKKIDVALQYAPKIIEGTGHDYGYNIDSDNGIICVSGRFLGNLTFDTKDSNPINLHSTRFDGYIACGHIEEVEINNTWLWAERIGGHGNDITNDLTLDGGFAYTASTLDGNITSPVFETTQGKSVLISKFNLQSGALDKYFIFDTENDDFADSIVVFENRLISATHTITNPGNFTYHLNESNNSKSGTLPFPGGVDIVIVNINQSNLMDSVISVHGGNSSEHIVNMIVGQNQIIAVGSNSDNTELGGVIASGFGGFSAELSFNATQVAKFQNINWFNSAENTQVRDVAIRNSGSDLEVYIIGDYQGTLNKCNNPITSSGFSDIFVAKFANTNSPNVECQSFGGIFNDNGLSIAINNDGEIAIGGTVHSPAHFGDFELTGRGDIDGFVTLIDPVSLSPIGNEAAISTGGPSRDAIMSVNYDDRGVVHFTGYVSGNGFSGLKNYSADQTSREIIIASFNTTVNTVFPEEIYSYSVGLEQNISIDVQNFSSVALDVSNSRIYALSGGVGEISIYEYPSGNYSHDLTGFSDGECDNLKQNQGYLAIVCGHQKIFFFEKSNIEINITTQNFSANISDYYLTEDSVTIFFEDGQIKNLDLPTLSLNYNASKSVKMVKYVNEQKYISLDSSTGGGQVVLSINNTANHSESFSINFIPNEINNTIDESSISISTINNLAVVSGIFTGDWVVSSNVENRNHSFYQGNEGVNSFFSIFFDLESGEIFPPNVINSDSKFVPSQRSFSGLMPEGSAISWVYAEAGNISSQGHSLGLGQDGLILIVSNIEGDVTNLMDAHKNESLVSPMFYQDGNYIIVTNDDSNLSIVKLAYSLYGQGISEESEIQSSYSGDDLDMILPGRKLVARYQTPVNFVPITGGLTANFWEITPLGSHSITEIGLNFDSQTGSITGQITELPSTDGNSCWSFEIKASGSSGDFFYRHDVTICVVAGDVSDINFNQDLIVNYSMEDKTFEPISNGGPVKSYSLITEENEHISIDNQTGKLTVSKSLNKTTNFTIYADPGPMAKGFSKSFTIAVNGEMRVSAAPGACFVNNKSIGVWNVSTVNGNYCTLESDQNYPPIESISIASSPDINISIQKMDAGTWNLSWLNPPYDFDLEDNLYLTLSNEVVESQNFTFEINMTGEAMKFSYGSENLKFIYNKSGDFYAPSFTLGVSNNFTIEENFYHITGLTFDSNSGKISGTPTNSIGSNFTFVVTAIHKYHDFSTGKDNIITSSAEVTIEIDPPKPHFEERYVTKRIKTETLVSIEQPIDGAEIDTWAITPALPGELEFNTLNGTIFGFSTEESLTKHVISAHNMDGAGFYELTLNITNLEEQEIHYPISHYDIMNGTLLQPIYPLSNTNFDTWSVSGNLPQGIDFISENGTFVGLVSEVGIFTLKVTASNANTERTTNITLDIFETPYSKRVLVEYLNVDDTSQFIGNTQQFQRVMIGQELQEIGPQVSSGFLSNFSIIPDPSVIAGLEFDSKTGKLSGTPTTLSPSGTKFTITASWILSPEFAPEQHDVKLDYTIFVDPPAPKFERDVYNVRMVIGQVANLTIHSSGGDVSQWSIIGDLPEGLFFDEYNGIFQGTPAETGDSSIVLQAKNLHGTATTTINLNLVLPGATPFHYSTSHVSSIVNERFNPIEPITSENMGGYYTIPALPNGLTIETQTGIISGYPQDVTEWEGIVVVQSQGDSYSTNLSISVTENAILIVTEAPEDESINANSQNVEEVIGLSIVLIIVAFLLGFSLSEKVKQIIQPAAPKKVNLNLEEE